MSAFATAWRIVRAVATAPDVAHWIRKYDVARRENEQLRHALESAQRHLRWSEEMRVKARKANRSAVRAVAQVRDHGKRARGQKGKQGTP